MTAIDSWRWWWASTRSTFNCRFSGGGWSQGVNAERIQLDPEIAGPRILVRAYATAEADAWRMRAEAGELPGDTGPRPSLEDRIRRYLRPHELKGDN